MNGGYMYRDRCEEWDNFKQCFCGGSGGGGYD